MSHSEDNKCQTVSWAVGDAPLELGHCIAAIGNFDGVHRGHGKVIEAAIDAARKAGVAAAAVTFDPHPREFFRHDDVPFCLADTINAMGADIGITATAVPLLSDENSAVISSSRIRAALQAGEVGQAATMLGHDWAVTGIVQLGDQRGRTIGFPTANIPLGALLHPAFGVYAVQIFDADPQAGFALLGNGVANIGIRPTVEDRGVLCEAHLFDQQPDLYGRRLAICLKSFLRAERKFTGIDELTSQIAKDARAAREILPPIRQTA